MYPNSFSKYTRGQNAKTDGKSHYVPGIRFLCRDAFGKINSQNPLIVNKKNEVGDLTIFIRRHLKKVNKNYLWH